MIIAFKKDTITKLVVLLFQDLCLKEEAPEAEELDMSEFVLECPHLYDVSAIDVGEETFTDLSDLSDSVLHMRQENVGKVFQVHFFQGRIKEFGGPG